MQALRRPPPAGIWGLGQTHSPARSGHEESGLEQRGSDLWELGAQGPFLRTRTQGHLWSQEGVQEGPVGWPWRGTPGQRERPELPRASAGQYRAGAKLGPGPRLAACIPDGACDKAGGPLTPRESFVVPLVTNTVAHSGQERSREPEPALRGAHQTRGLGVLPGSKPPTCPRGFLGNPCPDHPQPTPP